MITELDRDGLAGIQYALFFEKKEKVMPEKMGVTKATAIAAFNAVVNYAGLGQFLSEFDTLDDYSIRYGTYAGNAQVSIRGRTNTGEWVGGSSTIVFKADRGKDFPVEKVIVDIHDSSREGFKDEYVHFECLFAEGRIIVKRLPEPVKKEPTPREQDDLDIRESMKLGY